MKKVIKHFIPVVLLCIISIHLVSLKLSAVEKRENLGPIAKITAQFLTQNHYNNQPVDDEVSENLFNEYIKTLDPNKFYFTKADIESFSSYKKQLDNNLLEGKFNFAIVVYDKFKQKLELYSKFAKNFLNSEVEFTKDDEFIFDRSKLDWSTGDNDLKEIWGKKIRNDILTLQLMERSIKENKNENGEDKPKAVWQNKTPKERVKKRIESTIKIATGMNEFEILEIYLSSLAKVYDPHSSYMSPRSEEEFNINMRLSLVGIGAVLTTEDGYTKIVKVIPGGPSEKDGRLKAEDRIVAVAQGDGEPVNIVDMPLKKVILLIRGEKNTKAVLTILSGSEGISAIPKIIVITRDEVKLKEQEASGIIKEITSSDGTKKKLGIITLPSFYMDFEAAYKNLDYKSTTKDVKKILKSFINDGVEGVILDLRSNGGGSLLESINLSGLFIKTGPIVQIKNQSGAIDVKYDKDDSFIYDGPFIVLINKLSASAAEIFAGAMQDYQRGVLIGDATTHGKGTVQSIFDLNNLSAFLGISSKPGSVKFTNAKFYRINGSSTQRRGIIPDIIFSSFTDSMKIGESNLDYALPWDSIKKVKFDIYQKDIQSIIPILKEKTVERQKSNKEFTLLDSEIKTYKRLRNKKTISLNMTARWNNYLKERELQEHQTELLKLKSDEENKNNDLHLSEACNILTDYIQILEEKKKEKVTTEKNLMIQQAQSIN